MSVSGKIPVSIAELARLYVDEKMTLKEVGQLFGVTPQAIAWQLSENGIPRRRKTYRPMTEEHLANLRSTVLHGADNPRFIDLPIGDIRPSYESGESIESLSDRFSVSTATVIRRLRDAGVPLRRKGFPGGWRFSSDGHRVQSGWEVIVDDWLAERSIPHEVHPVLPFGKRQLADFLARGRFVEIWGVINNPSYEEQRRSKLANYRAHGLELIELTSDQIRHGDFAPLAVLLE